MRASDVTPAKNIFALFIGKSGSGKDCAAFSFPTPMKVFDIDLRAEGGAIGTRRWLSNEHLSKIDITRVLPNKGWAEIENELITLMLQYQKGQRPYETIYFGSLTSLSDLFTSEAGRLISGLSIKDGNSKSGGVRLTGPADYKYLYAAMKDFMDYIRVYPVNLICSAHMMDRYAKKTKETRKPDGSIETVEDQYGESEVVGEKLTLTDKLSENIQIYFNEVYRFEKRMSGDADKYYVKFRTDIAKTVYPSLPRGEKELTGKSFYHVWKEYVEKDTVKEETKK